MFLFTGASWSDTELDEASAGLEGALAEVSGPADVAGADTVCAKADETKAKVVTRVKTGFIRGISS
jgi:hypothetical protein